MRAGLLLLATDDSCRVQQAVSKADQAELVKRLEAIFPISTAHHAAATAAAPAPAPPQV